ncbi:MAG: hypothetical protein AVDCRST_MAG71-1633, partial [uncultured Lysobacter sp.]
EIVSSDAGCAGPRGCDPGACRGRRCRFERQGGHHGRGHRQARIPRPRPQRAGHLPEERRHARCIRQDGAGQARRRTDHVLVQADLHRQGEGAGRSRERRGSEGQARREPECGRLPERCRGRWHGQGAVQVL